MSKCCHTILSNRLPLVSHTVKPLYFNRACKFENTEMQACDVFYFAGRKFIYNSHCLFIHTRMYICLVQNEATHNYYMLQCRNYARGKNQVQHPQHVVKFNTKLREVFLFSFCDCNLKNIFHYMRSVPVSFNLTYTRIKHCDLYPSKNITRTNF